VKLFLVLFVRRLVFQRGACFIFIKKIYSSYDPRTLALAKRNQIATNIKVRRYIKGRVQIQTQKSRLAAYVYVYVLVVTCTCTVVQVAS
jgi:hypothetical protein